MAAGSGDATAIASDETQPRNVAPGAIPTIPGPLSRPRIMPRSRVPCLMSNSWFSSKPAGQITRGATMFSSL